MYDVLTIEDWIRRLYQGYRGINDPRRIWIEQYAYPYTILAFSGQTGGAASVGNLQINSNADFVLTRISYTASLAAAMNTGALPVVQARANIVDGGSARPFFNAAVTLENFAQHSPTGAGRFMSYPRFLSANTTLQITLTPFGTAAETFSNIDFLFEGMNIREYSPGMMASTIGQPQAM